MDPAAPEQGADDPWAPPPPDRRQPDPGHGYGQPQWAPPTGYGPPPPRPVYGYAQPQWAPPSAYGLPPGYGYGTPDDCYGSPGGAYVGFGVPPAPAGEQVAFASAGQRFGARFLDLLVPCAVFFAVFFSIGFIGGILDTSYADNGNVTALGFAAVTVISIAYEVVLTATRGQTLGKMAFQIKVVRSGGARVGWGPSFARWGLPFGLIVIPFFGWIAALLCYLAICWNGQRQGWHDKVAKTFVVRSR